MASLRTVLPPPVEEPQLYTDLASWWPMFSPPEEYCEEAEDLLPMLRPEEGPARTMLELGSGGGSLAYHLKKHFTLTLTDRSAEMVAVSRKVNPECEHRVGDMRTLRLGRTFDRVMVHDAIMYAVAREDARATVLTAAAHCRAGGRVVLLPDCVRETFEPLTESGGHDGPDGRGMRYLMWTWDPDPDDETFETAFAYLLREADGTVSMSQERHRFGLFRRDDWLEWMREAGCPATTRRDPWNREVFIGVREQD
ncbi:MULTISPECIES: class I SAM-dependent methyltransferase [unclassified Corallococcus]|uniref:class I SAM-dependent methyltransferase n=1 Tax=unclassified Corallococcus TaxID=2685029 RepID=UPI001A901FE0|nr:MULTISPECIES: class I SAM-dependent methyltransferase [unclassified Corallococcus]MBN9681313.1 class I SAM-dependent methyltransferase [Corallococcus sp. NCSPR001]WAS87106.1 class I SAM-dependent methyltransferase [Corallococcus sp. NCRR]